MTFSEAGDEAASGRPPEPSVPSTTVAGVSQAATPAPLDIAALRKRLMHRVDDGGTHLPVEVHEMDALLDALEAAQADRDRWKTLAVENDDDTQAAETDAVVLRRALEKLQVAMSVRMGDDDEDSQELHAMKLATAALITGAGKALAEELQEFRKWKAEHGG